MGKVNSVVPVVCISLPLRPVHACPVSPPYVQVHFLFVYQRIYRQVYPVLVYLITISPDNTLNHSWKGGFSSMCICGSEDINKEERVQVKELVKE